MIDINKNDELVRWFVHARKPRRLDQLFSHIWIQWQISRGDTHVDQLDIIGFKLPDQMW